MRYQIKLITQLSGRLATDDTSMRRIGRKGRILQLAIGKPMLFAYAPPEIGTLATSEVTDLFNPTPDSVQVTTKNHVYHLRKVQVQTGGEST